MTKICDSTVFNAIAFIHERFQSNKLIKAIFKLNLFFLSAKIMEMLQNALSLLKSLLERAVPLNI
jgi:hypothetical protein